ncbi:unnamed protein product [Amoebophrya sp. A25]|nr:unnamed protein product [Amoebophrya sp. A25]|eukprot:GSA25T00019140001.1
MSARKSLHFFMKQVHPDASGHVLPVHAKRVNQQSLMVLNSYLDRLDGSSCQRTTSSTRNAESRAEPDSSTPFLRQQLPFFRPLVRKATGEIVSNRAVPLILDLPTLPPGASFMLRDQAATDLLEQAKQNLDFQRSRFSDLPHGTGRSLLRDAVLGNINGDSASTATTSTSSSETSSSRASSMGSSASRRVVERFEKLWDTQTHDVMFKDALYDDPAATKRLAAMEAYRRRYQAQLLRKALKTKNKQGRRRRLESVDKRAEAKVVEKFGAVAGAGQQEPEPHSVEQDGGERCASGPKKLRMIEYGYHPDLVFMEPGLTPAQQTEGIRRCCGVHLQKENNTAEFWLLENLWRAMRGTEQSPSTSPEDHDDDRKRNSCTASSARIPLVLCAKEGEYRAERGCVFVPYNFDVAALSALLEEELDVLRADLVQRKQQGNRNEA